MPIVPPTRLQLDEDSGKMCGYAGQSYTYHDGGTNYRGHCSKDDVVRMMP